MAGAHQTGAPTLGARHVFVADDRPARGFPDWCHQASRITDAHRRSGECRNTGQLR